MIKDYGHHVIALFATKHEMGTPKGHPRYLGMAFFTGPDGEIATCKHVIESINNGEMFYAATVTASQIHSPVFNIKCHPKYDFAIAKTYIKDTKALPLSENKQPFIGEDIVAFGMTSDGIINNELRISARLFKGSIVRTFRYPLTDDSRSTCEVSFPSLSGFSGTAIINNNQDQTIAGMLFSNFESAIELYRDVRIEESGEKYSEQIHKVVELGIAHTAEDIRIFTKDLENEPYIAFV